MNRTDINLNRDPYMHSATKQQRPHSASMMPPNYHHPQNRESVQALKRKLNHYENDIMALDRARINNQNIAKKVLNLNATNTQFHQALKLRNFDLTNRVQDIALQRDMLLRQNEQQIFRQKFRNDNIIKKYEEQIEEIFSLKKQIGIILEAKQRLEQQVNRLVFIIQNDNGKSALELRQQLIRMENMQRTYKGIIQTKDNQISQLYLRLRGYQDENRRLNELNKTLQITSKQLQNLSHIHHVDSHTKSPHWSIQKQNYPGNQLNEQKKINQKLLDEIQKLKKKLTFEEDIHHKPAHSHEHQHHNIHHQDNDHHHHQDHAKLEGLLLSITTLRNGINKQVFEIFFKSVKEGDKKRQNSLVIFITNWKALDLERLQPYVVSYFQARDNLKQLYADKKFIPQHLHSKVQEILPYHVGTKKGRSNINEWILSTVQYTKNQREAGKKTLNNLLLFLFRLLTIEYRITYPMQGKSFTIDNDVKNQLLHEIVKAIDYIIQLK